MQRFFVLALIAVGIAWGWRLGRPPAAPVEEASPIAAWRHYQREITASRTCEHDVPPHPAWIAGVLALAATGVLGVACRTHREAVRHEIARL